MWYVIAVALLYGPYNATVEEVINAETIKMDVADLARSAKTGRDRCVGC